MAYFISWTGARTSSAANVGVMTLPDDVREEEVLACVVLKTRADCETADLGRTLFDFPHTNLAYYKAPGWL